MVSIKKIKDSFFLFRNNPGQWVKKTGQHLNPTEEDYTFKVKIFGGNKCGFIYLGSDMRITVPWELVGKKIRLKVEIVE